MIHSSKGKIAVKGNIVELAADTTCILVELMKQHEKLFKGDLNRVQGAMLQIFITAYNTYEEKRKKGKKEAGN